MTPPRISARIRTGKSEAIRASKHRTIGVYRAYQASVRFGYAAVYTGLRIPLQQEFVVQLHLVSKRSSEQRPNPLIPNPSAGPQASGECGARTAITLWLVEKMFKRNGGDPRACRSWAMTASHQKKLPSFVPHVALSSFRTPTRHRHRLLGPHHDLPAPSPAAPCTVLRMIAHPCLASYFTGPWRSQERYGTTYHYGLWLTLEARTPGSPHQQSPPPIAAPQIQHWVLSRAQDGDD
ncbi:hypothetical protein EDB83DRAFT_848547 [Lactarius deliciosus]|nr:hypothetical protein EDB83DRAFT_848547 [Lactarius deliciosus]